MKQGKKPIRRQPFRIRQVLVIALVSACAPAAHGQICAVNVDQNTIQGAVDNPACGTVFVSAGTFDESVTIGRSLTLVGSVAGQTTISGQLVVSGSGVSATLSDLAVEGCFVEAMQVIAGATASATNVSAQKSTALRCSSMQVFSDDFESGGTARWSKTTRSNGRAVPSDRTVPTS